MKRREKMKDTRKDREEKFKEWKAGTCSYLPLAN
jgi:hypothetical protein